MPLLERGELLERERVDLAEHRQRALGGAEPLLLLLADVRRRLRAPSSAFGRPRRLDRRHEVVGAVVRDQRVGVEPELLQRALLELLDAHPLLGAGHLVAVHGVDQLVVLAAEVAQPGADRAAAPPRGRARACSTAARSSAAAARSTPPAGPARRRRRRPTASATRPSRISRSRRAIGAGPGLALVPGRP